MLTDYTDIKNYKEEMQTLDDYIKVIKEIDSAIVSELTSLLP